MITTPHAAGCEGCGAPLRPGAEVSLCAKCLWENGASADNNHPPEENETLAELAELLPDYEWLGVIGRGGMGTVYKARQKRLDRVVAIKVLSEEISVESKFASRFEREAKILAQLNHPHIVTIHDFGQELGLYYLVMEHVDGIDLAQALRKAPLPLHRSLRIARQLCSALVFAHERGVLHRDIKPANILVDNEGMVKMADFGLAKLGRSLEAAPAGATLTVPGATMGTPRYMAPEQWEAPERIDQRTDLFAFGMIFYELLTTEVPSGMIEMPSSKAAVDKRADEIVRNCLAPDPDKRYASARDLETDLMALEQSSATHTPATHASDSWLRTPSLVLPEPDDYDPSSEVTVIATDPSPSTEKRPRYRKWLSPAALVLLLGVLAGLFFRPATEHRNTLTLISTPNLTNGPWWFNETPYLLPPVRLALEKDETRFLVPQTANEATAFQEELRHAAHELSEVTDDAPLRGVLERLLNTRSIKAQEILSLIPESELPKAAWQHTRAVLHHQLGDHQAAEQGYRDAIRQYRVEESPKGLIALCQADLAHSLALSGRFEDAVAAYERALDTMRGEVAPFFRVTCLAGKADACRRFQSWEEAEQALRKAKNVLDAAGVKRGHPTMTYILQRFGWLYMDDWKLKDARIAFEAAIASRKTWLDTVTDPALSTQLRQHHDEMALAMSLRYAGNVDEAITGYEQVRQSLQDLKQRVNRTPVAQREWISRYYNTCERLGDCYLFARDQADKAAHLFSQAAMDLERELSTMASHDMPTFRVQQGRLLAKATIAHIGSGINGDALSLLQSELGDLQLEGKHQSLLTLFAEIGNTLTKAQQPQTVQTALEQLEASVDTNQNSQFGRDVRELYLLACAELASRCQGDSAQQLARVMRRLLPRDPVDPSVLPFLRPHFERLITLRRKSESVSWDLLRDIQWAKTGSRLGEDLPDGSVFVFYVRPSESELIHFAPGGQPQVQILKYGFTNLSELTAELEGLEIFAPAIQADWPPTVYWTDLSVIPPLKPDTFPASLSSSLQIQ